MNLRIGPISRLLSPGYSECHRCCTTWRFVKPHSTDYESHDTYFVDDTGKFKIPAVMKLGINPLCEKCWSELTPEQRLPYYRQAIWNINTGESTARAIEDAVLSGG